MLVTYEKEWNMPSKIPSRLAQIFGSNVARRRQLLNMSQAEFSEKLDIAPDVVSRVENGYIAPRFGRIELIASLLDCSVADLFRETPGDTASNAATLAELIRPLPPQKQEEVISLVAQLVQVLKTAT